MPTEFATDEFTRHCQECRQERQVFFRQNQTASPACVALFRIAIQTNHQQAWSCIKEIFEPLLIGWVSKQQRFDTEEVVQETWYQFYKGTTQNFTFSDYTYVAPILSFLKTCALNTLAQMARKPSLRISLDTLDDMADTAADVNDEIAQAQLRIDLEQTLAAFFQEVQFTQEEYTIFVLKFVQQLKPREILVQWPHLAKDYDELEVSLQRISRRVRQYEGFHKLATPRRKTVDSALLKIVTVQMIEAKEINVDQPCKYNEVLLLDYMMGLLPPAIAAGIEASPVCVQQVQRLAWEMTPFLQHVYRMHCPTATDLVAYQQRRLPGGERLVIYRHLEDCLRCQEDLQMLAAVDAEGERRSTLLRRVIEAIYQPALAIGLQGDWLHYQTPDLFINISINQENDKQRNWTVHLQLRTQLGELQSMLVESVEMASLAQPATERFVGTLDARKRSLVFRDLPMGEYSLSIVMPNEEVIIRKLLVGFDA
jgi:DNA-directed RNA polymerase specialized sigma24 family protein